MTPAVGAIAPVITVGGAELRQEVLSFLIGMRVSSELRLPSRVRLDFIDDGFALSAGNTFGIGKTIVVAAGDTKLFTGEVTGVELDVEHGAPNLTVIADDLAYKLTLGNKVVTYANMTYSDVVRKIARNLGMRASVSDTSSTHEYLLQTDSDFGFISEIADRIGYDWWVDAEGTLQFHPMGKATGKTPELQWGNDRANLRHFAVRTSALHPTKVTVNGWDAETSTTIVAPNESVEGTSTANLVKPFVEASSLKSLATVSSSFRQFRERGDGTAMATSAVAAALAGAVNAEGLCGVNPAVRVGSQVAVLDVGPASGTYSVTQVEHTYGPRGFETRFVAGDRVPTSLVDTLTTPVVSSFRQDAMVVGIVTNTGDKNSPKGYVKVKFPTLGDQVESAWARVVALGAGASRGMTFLPEVNDEVIVGFEGGDVSRPLVLGGLYSAKRTALDYGVNAGKVEKRQIVSRLGHVIEMGDGQGDPDQHISMTLAGGKHAVRLGKDGLSATVPSGQPVSITAGSTKIEFDKQGNITMSGGKITIKATQDVEISGMNVKVKANVAVEASGAQAKVSGSGTAEISAGGVTQVKGSIVKIN